jgi:Mg-chelatase subunit ChlD
MITQDLWLYRAGMVAVATLLLLSSYQAIARTITLDAPDSAEVGAELSIAFGGEVNPNDFITVVAPDASEGSYAAYQYTRKSPAVLIAPSDPGNYEVRYLDAASPYPTLARRLIEIVDVRATLEAPAQVDAGAPLVVRWQGPGNPRDFVSIVPAGTPSGEYRAYQYTERGAELTLTAPDAAGDYEIRYMLGVAPYRTIGMTPLRVGATEAELVSVAQVMAGSPVSVTFTGPDNAQDFITLVAKDAPDGQWANYVYTARGNPAVLAAPETPGDYELRYMTGQSYSVLARAPLTVTPASASLDAADEVMTGDIIEVRWQGPGNDLDYVIVLPADASADSGPYAYVRRGPELRIDARLEPGSYVLHYMTGREQLSLAERPIAVTPRPEPGFLRVVDDRTATLAEGSVVSVVLDASGSMLQRIDGETRISIARTAVTQLTDSVLPDGIRFTLRVFGHREAESCRTDLEIPIGPLDRDAARRTISGVNAMNLARTPIARSLELAAEDLAAHDGHHVIILVTDGEETCDGDPAAAIEELRARGLDVRVNIIGFAIDELMLRETFASWARLGQGRYFDASDADELHRALAQSIDVPFELLTVDDRQVTGGVVNGDAVSAPPGTYRLRVASHPEPVFLDVTVVAGEEGVVTLDSEPANQ